MPQGNLQGKINAQGLAYIESIRATVAQLWQKACEQDGIPPESKFVVFSPDNKYVQFHNRAVGILSQAEAEYRAGGYVGLKIERRDSDGNKGALRPGL